MKVNCLLSVAAVMCDEGHEECIDCVVPGREMDVEDMGRAQC